MLNHANLTFDLLPKEITLIIFYFLANEDWNSLTLVNKDFLFLSDLLWANKVREDFNCRSDPLPSHKFFYRSLSAELAKEKKLFSAFQKALYMQQFINLKFDHYDQYYSFAWIELNRCNCLEESKTAFLQGINEHISLISNKTRGPARIEFNEGLIKAEKQADILFDTLLTNPTTLSLTDLQLHVNELCRLDASCALGIVFKKIPALTIDLATLFTEAIHSLHLNTMQKIIELGLDLRNKIPFRQCHGYFADFNITDTWLTYTFMSLDRILFQKLHQLPDSEKISAPGVRKTKAIINFLLESGINCDDVICYDEENHPKTLRLYCQTELANKVENRNEAIDSIYKDILLLITNFSPLTTSPRLGR